jgi:hypothetical protein
MHGLLALCVCAGCIALGYLVHECPCDRTRLAYAAPDAQDCVPVWRHSQSHNLFTGSFHAGEPFARDRVQSQARNDYVIVSVAP